MANLYRTVALPVMVAVALMTPWVMAQDEEAVEDAPAAEETEGNAELPSSAIYIPMQPAFVVNYGGTGRLKYLKAELSIRVADVESATRVRHHMPLIRNSMVMLFSRQTDEDLDTLEGKEMLRQTALNNINTLLMEEEGESGVVDLYFNNLLVQK